MSGAERPSLVAPRRVLPVGSLLGGDRFRLLRRIGEGGMGVVYEAFDAQRDERVALKTLSQSDPRGIYQFKHEFRSLSELHHPGLVRLHHLFAEHDTWFFTMDLIDGERFDRSVRPGGALDEQRLRDALGQLVRALSAIHEAGKLHRDVKSSNVLVAREGRVVVLDLGLCIESGKGGAGQTISEWVIAGTPEYMAPEQAFGFPASPASDFYGMGVMLFEALTGRLPFKGQLGEILVAKQHAADLLPRLRASGAPSDLAELCFALLSKRAEDRPTAQQMLESHSLSASSPSAPGAHGTAPDSRRQARPALLGRLAELGVLAAAQRDAAAGQPVLVEVSGESGIGKSELCSAFLDSARAAGVAIVLSGRCYERDGVPFKAIDALVDELSRHLRRASREEVAALLPRDVFALVKLFPVLGRVDVIAEAPARELSDPYELQRRAFAAFGELLGRMRDRRPLILHIDDAHWADADSATFLRHVLVDRGLCALLLVISRRSEARPDSAALDSLLDAARANPALSVRPLPVPAMPADDAERLARELSRRDGHPFDPDLCRSIALEARGSPFLVSELARLSKSGEHAGVRPLVGDVVTARVEGMAPSARGLLELVALVGQPLAARVACEATGATHADLDALIEAHLMRDSEAGGQELVECYHDRIRETIALELAPDAVRAHYRQLGQALARDPAADPELLSRCWEGAGDRAEAARHAAEAARRASLAMAFDHAAALYERAIALGPVSGDPAIADPAIADPAIADPAELPSLLAQALENAGRGAEAALVYRRAAALATGEHSLELSRRAAEQWLASGHVDEGLELLRSLCDTLGVHFPVSPGSVLLSLAWTALRLHTRDLRGPVAPSRASARDALRLRTARTVVTSLSGYLPAHAATVAGQYLIAALDAGDIHDRVRAVGFNAYIQSHIDPASPRTAMFLARMDELANQSGKTELIAFASLMKGTTAVHSDRHREARQHFAHALAHLRGQAGVAWEIDVANIYDQLSASYAGDYAEIARTTPPLVDEALRRGRVWTGALLSGFSGMPAWVGIDGGQGYRRQLAEVSRHWKPRARPQWPDFLLLMGEALLSIYQGQPQRGFDLLEVRRAAYDRNMLDRGSGKGRISYAIHHARCAAAALGAGRRCSATRGERTRWTVHLSRTIAIIEKRGSPNARAFATLFQAVLALDEGVSEAGVGLLRRAVGAFDQAGMRLYAAACQRRLGQMVAGDEGRVLVERGEEFMRWQGVVDVERETEMHCPGVG
jgi:tetratricopeptide (TPR) repeat protein